MAIKIIRRDQATQAVKIIADTTDELDEAIDFAEVGDLAVVSGSLYWKNLSKVWQKLN